MRNQKVIIIAVLIVVIMLVSYVAFGKEKDITETFLEKAKEAAKKTTNVVTGGGKKEETFSEIELLQMAEQIHTYLNGMWTENEEAVIKLMSKLKTKTDYYLLLAAFGVRKSTGMVIYFEGTLPQWIAEYFSESDIKDLNEILSKIGVTL